MVAIRAMALRASQKPAPITAASGRSRRPSSRLLAKAQPAESHAHVVLRQDRADHELAEDPDKDPGRPSRTGTAVRSWNAMSAHASTRAKISPIARRPDPPVPCSSGRMGIIAGPIVIVVIELRMQTRHEGFGQRQQQFLHEEGEIEGKRAEQRRGGESQPSARCRLACAHACSRPISGGQFISICRGKV